MMLTLALAVTLSAAPAAPQQTSAGTQVSAGLLAGERVQAAVESSRPSPVDEAVTTHRPGVSGRWFPSPACLCSCRVRCARVATTSTCERLGAQAVPRLDRPRRRDAVGLPGIRSLPERSSDSAPGMGIGHVAGDDGVLDDFTARFNGIVLGGIGAGVGAAVGAVIGR